ncbi:MAG: 50S ribosomal protein L19 [Spirochaetes bacterium]|nr:50S ribosomal protein L19 [Spirochaetota bacterium]
MSVLIKKVEAAYLKNEVPELAIGDTVRATIKVIEGEKERLQAFEGVLLALQGTGINRTMKLRKISFGIGVERNIPVHSPRLTELVVTKKGRARRAKLYYLRSRVGKEALKTKNKI